MKHVSTKVILLWLIRNLVLLLPLVAAYCIAMGNLPRDPVSVSLLTLLFLANAVLLLVWPRLRYKYYTYSVDDKRIVLRSGVIFRHQITAPICQIQDLHFFEGPVMRLLGLGKVMFSTAGSNFDLVGLPKAEAQALVEELETKLRRRMEVAPNEEI